MFVPISSTGIRNGEIIIGREGKASGSTTIQVRGFYPPGKKWVDEMPDTVLRDIIGRIPYFLNMSVQQRRQELLRVSTLHDDLYLDDVNGISLRFISISGKGDTSIPGKLGDETVSMLLKGNPADPEGYWPIAQVMDMFPKKPGSKARKHALIFRPTLWQLLIHDVVSSYNGMGTRIDDGIIWQDKITKQAGTGLCVINKYFRSDITPTLGIIGTLGKELILSEVLAIANQIDPYVKDIPQNMISWFSPSIHKSLIQKIIRTRCKNVSYNDSLYSGTAMLLLSFSMLLVDPGSFVPDIQRYVTGLESATKRLAVSIVEDSYVKDPKVITSLFAASLFAQTDRSYIPSLSNIKWWMEAAIEAQQNPTMYEYDVNPPSQFNEWSNHLMSYLILGEIKSFETDVNMMGSIAINNGHLRNLQPHDGWDKMEITHCLDHHSLTEIAYFTSRNIASFAELFHEIWSQVTGKNARKGQYIEDNEVTRDIRNAQRLLWITKTYVPQKRPVLGASILFSYKIDLSQLAGIIGPISFDLPKRVTAIVVLRCDDITEFNTIRKPSRDAKEPTELTEEERDIAIRMMRLKLQQGIVLDNVPDTLLQLKGKVVYWHNEEYIFSDGKTVDETFNLTYQLPIHPKINNFLSSSLLLTGDGISEEPDMKWIYNQHPLILQRLLTYLSGYRTNIRLNQISRDGTGTDYAVSPLDISVNHILGYIACVYPAAIQKEKIGWKVKNGPLMWSIRDAISKSIRGVEQNKYVWGQLSTRPLWQHQEESVKAMLEKHASGKRGHLIWITAGMGKTAITIEYIIRLGSKMQEYCVYTLPPSAMDSIKREFDIYKISYQELDMVKGGKNKVIQPGIVNLIKHDHLRLAADQLRQLAGKMLFVVDEFHKTLAKTQRTSITLEIVRLSADFVGMSGTIIKDENTDELIQWLEQIVEFEVTKHNYWVAVGALISKKVQLPIVVDRVVIEAQILDQENYKKTIPESIGGTARNINMPAALKYCYDAITQEMVNQTRFYLNNNEGVFLVAKDNKHMELLYHQFPGIRIHMITNTTPITLTYTDITDIKIVITTPKHVEGYTLTKFRVMITGVYFSNNATREQTERRINRIGQQSNMVRIITIHAGILSYVNDRYEKVRTMAEALRGFAADVGADYKQMLQYF